MVIADVILEEWARLNYLLIVYRGKMVESSTKEQENRYRKLLDETASRILDLQDYANLAKRDKESKNGERLS